MSKKFFISYSFLLSSIYASIFCLSIIAILGFVYFFSVHYRLQQVDRDIVAEMLTIVENFSVNGDFQLDALSNFFASRVQAQMPTDPSLYLLAFPSGDRVAGNLTRMPSADFDDEGVTHFALSGYGQDGSESHHVRARAVKLPSGFLLMTGRDVNDLVKLQGQLIRILAWSVAITVILAIAGAWLFNQVLSRRLERVNSTCRAVMDGEFSKRIQTNESGDGFDRLSTNVNNMLDRIEMLMEGIRRVSDNIAHDLKTPLTRLRNSLSRASMSNENSREMIECAIEEADSLLSTFDALRRIANVEFDSSTAGFSTFQPDVLVNDVVELYEPIAESKSVTIQKISGSDTGSIHADRDLVFQALVNLMDNAIKYTPENSTIRISGSHDENGFLVQISDSGPGIPEAYHDKVRQRFFRMESSRTTPGNGLGLSMVDVVARMHGASLKFENSAPGLRVTLGYFKNAIGLDTQTHDQAS